MSQPHTPHSAGLRRIRIAGAVGVALLLAAAVYFLWWTSAALDERGQPATAQVVSLQKSKYGVVDATVRFSTADGRTITTRTRPGELVSPPPAVGSTIPIVYDPENPQALVRDPRAPQNEIGAPQESITGPVALAAVGLAGIGALVVMIKRRRSRPAPADDAG